MTSALGRLKTEVTLFPHYLFPDRVTGVLIELKKTRRVSRDLAYAVAMVRSGEKNKSIINQIASVRCAKCGKVFNVTEINKDGVHTDRLNVLKVFQSHVCGPMDKSNAELSA